MIFKLEGADALLAKLHKGVKFADAKEVVKSNGSDLQIKMHSNATFIKGYQTGTTKRSVNMTLTKGGLVATVAPETEYAKLLELGTRFMTAQPFIGPSYYAQEPLFIRDLKRLME